MSGHVPVTSTILCLASLHFKSSLKLSRLERMLSPPFFFYCIIQKSTDLKKLIMVLWTLNYLLSLHNSNIFCCSRLPVRVCVCVCSYIISYWAQLQVFSFSLLFTTDLLKKTPVIIRNCPKFLSHGVNIIPVCLLLQTSGMGTADKTVRRMEFE